MQMVELKSTVGHLLRRAQQVSTAIFTQKLMEYDLTSVQFLALAAIIENGQLDATRLSESIAFDRATIGGVIERLERKGLIERRASDADRRVKVVRARPAARALVQICLPKVQAVQQELLEPLSPDERITFISMLARVARESTTSSVQSSTHSSSGDCGDLA